MRGRRLLRERLDRRGVSLGAALVFWLLDPSKAPSVPGVLLESTVRAMSLAASGRHAALASRFSGALEMAEDKARLGNLLAGSLAVGGTGAGGDPRGAFRARGARLRRRAGAGDRPGNFTEQFDRHPARRVRLEAMSRPGVGLAECESTVRRRP